jgi:ABC-type polysaccharide/polyol phosphate export permease
VSASGSYPPSPREEAEVAAVAAQGAPVDARPVAAGRSEPPRPARWPGAGLWRARELILLLVLRDLKARYKRSALGMAWTLLNPLLQMAVYSIVFSRVVKLGVPGYPVFVLSGLLPWSLVQVGTLSASTALLANQGLLRKVAVPQAVYPLAVVGGKLVDTVLSLAPLAVVAAALGRTPGRAWLFVPVGIGLAAAFTTGLALLFASLTVFFRDLRHLLEVLFQAWFYVTPVLWPADALRGVDPRLATLLSLNPAAPLVRCLQAPVHEGRLPDGGTVAAAALAALVSLALGLWAFHRAEARHIHWL